jgi:hypothetical protein
VKNHLPFAALAAIVALSCSKKPDSSVESVAHVVFGEYVQPADSFPAIRYFEGGLVSQNDRCAVRKVKLNTKMPPVYVNGRPIGFC